MPSSSSRLAPLAAAFGAAAVAMVVLDLTWLGVVAQKYYADALGPLEREQPVVVAAALFYAMYLAAIVFHAVTPSQTLAQAARRGAALGFVAYATYELTNWAVLRGWPARLVPVDLAWGVVLTATAAAAGFAAFRRAGGVR
jgi:uncharacterized membrane protein